MDDDIQVRASDFRKAWPNALTRSLREMGDLVEKLDLTSQNTINLIEQVPKLIKTVNDRLTVAGDSQTKLIQAICLELDTRQGEFIKAFTEASEKLEKERSEKNAMLASIFQAKKQLDKARADFNKLSFFKRVFARA